MNISSGEIAITIVLPEATVGQLIEALSPLMADQIQTVQRSTKEPEKPQRNPEPRVSRPVPQPGNRSKYQLEFLGSTVGYATLPEVFAAAIDLVHDLDPKSLERLSRKQPSNKRNYISRDETKVHIHSPNLPTLKTKSGWWISKNISESQLIGSLTALCRAAGMEYGKDLRLL